MIPEEVVRELKGKKNARVLVQLPEGLKTKAVEIAGELRQKGFEPIVSGDLCFGACDLKTLKGATTLHVGHSEFVRQENVVYWEYDYGQGLVPAAEKALPLLGERVGLFTTVQHLKKIGEAKKFLEGKGKTVLTAAGKTTRDYQILGCDAAGAVKIKGGVDSFLYIGGGRFHPIAIAYYTGKPVVAIDPFSLELQEIDSAVWEKDRALRQTKAMNASSYGILVSSKPGQKNWNLAETIKKKLESAGKETLVIYLENITPDTLLPYGVDAFVVTACPRIVVDDWKSYKKAVLLPEEV
ncbi:MAG: diphthamide biosynthesis enzyme Dph2 [Candidatus Diapherotrites archaeon]|nr:diphthamide biosynthesis enzyme Dph2 [Candidatus Diapherotrites archaeon]